MEARSYLELVHVFPLSAEVVEQQSLLVLEVLQSVVGGGQVLATLHGVGPLLRQLQPQVHPPTSA